MTYDPRIHHRRSIRLEGYDYSQAGAYFVTVCTRGRICLLGDVIGGEMRLNERGRIVQEAWCGLPDHYPHVELDAFVIMPNHVHMIIVLLDSARADSAGAGSVRAGSVRAGSVRAGFKPAPTIGSEKRHALPEIIRAFKTFSARRINEHSAIRGGSLWHRNYYEHIIRNDLALFRIRQYIAENPQQWPWDPDNPATIRPHRPDPRPG